jgi:hypothetical protein
MWTGRGSLWIDISKHWPGIVPIGQEEGSAIHYCSCSETTRKAHHLPICVDGNTIKIYSHEDARAFWAIAPFSLGGVDRRFRGAYCLHHQGDHQDAVI